MKGCRLVRFFYPLCAVAGLCTAASPEVPFFLAAQGNEPTSLDVFNAFHASPLPPEPHSTVRVPIRDGAAIYPNEFRTFDGLNNNADNRLFGAADTPLLRQTTVAYADGIGSPSGADRKSARAISNAVLAQSGLILNSENITSFVWQWGQFIDHDIGLSRVSNPAEEFDIPVPKGDPVFDPRGTGKKVLPFQRSGFQMVNGIRQPVNVNSAFIDGSTIYGSGVALAGELRLLDGSGQLKASANNLLPFNVNRFPNQPNDSATFFLSGDVRANENVGLTCLHTLFMREHNFWATSIKGSNPDLNDDDIYKRARAIVGAEIEVITYRDFIPILLGPNALDPYVAYDPAIDATESNELSTFGFRVGHTLLPPVLQRLNSRNHSLGDIKLGLGFFNPTLLPVGGIEPFLRGLSQQQPQEVDPYITDAVRNFLIGGRVAGFDLASLNIQRGRDHGLPGYNQVRLDYGLSAKPTFADMTSDPDLQAKLASAYSSPDDVDPWVGCLTETHLPGALVGETMFTILKDQFRRLRDGDRFWYEAYLDPETLATVQAQSLSIIIRRNTTITTELQDDVFHLP
jgi:peroxidase